MARTLKQLVIDRTFKEFLQEYQSTTSERRKAELEKAMWDQLEPAERREFHGKAKWLHVTFGVSQHTSGSRSRLLNAPEGPTLWPYVERKEMVPRTAMRLIVEAREEAARRKVAVSVALHDVLAEYERGSVRKMADGTVHRARGSTHLSKSARDRARRERQRKRSRKKTAKATRETAFWEKLRGLITDYVFDELPDGEVIDLDPLWRGLEVDLKVVIDDFQVRMSRARTAHKANGNGVRRNKVREACLLLRIDPPGRGKPINLKRAKRNKHRLAREYHPDAHGGDESWREQYEAVLSAYRVVEQYAQEEKEKQEATRV